MEQKDGKFEEVQMFTLASLRKRVDLTSEEVSKFTGISRNKILSLEKDSSKINMDDAKKLANLYGVPVGLIFFGKEQTLVWEIRKSGGYSAQK